MKFIYKLLLLFALTSCAKKTVPISNQNQDLGANYWEDLSEFSNNLIPIVEEGKNNSKKEADWTNEPLYINEKVDAVVERQIAKNKAIKYANGFRIQMYVGHERKLVEEAKMFAYQSFPNLNPYLSFSLPIYKLKIGDFLNKAEAEKIFRQLKDLYPEAQIIPDKIEIAKSFLK